MKVLGQVGGGMGSWLVKPSWDSQLQTLQRGKNHEPPTCSLTLKLRTNINSIIAKTITDFSELDNHVQTVSRNATVNKLDVEKTNYNTVFVFSCLLNETHIITNLLEKPN